MEDTAVDDWKNLFEIIGGGLSPHVLILIKFNLCRYYYEAYYESFSLEAELVCANRGRPFLLRQLVRGWRSFADEFSNAAPTIARGAW